MKKIILISFFVLVCIISTHADWIPPENPEPDKILDEARADFCAERYEDALAKHVWFFQNALKYDLALYGVRLSFALSDWVELGSVYPPALEKLKSVRDEAGKNVREGSAVRGNFHDFASINEYLGEDDKTKELFIWLDSNAHNLAEDVFDLALPALIKAKEYNLCGKYIDPDSYFQEILSRYNRTKAIAQSPKFGEDLLDFANKSFLNDTATLVALLVVNGRKVDANRIAAEAIKEWDAPEFKEQLEKAKNGEMPIPWP
jgi:hypothetical protein